MGVHRQIARAFFAAGIGAIEHAIMLRLQMRCAFQRHRTANMVICRVDLCLGKAQMAQQIKGPIVQLVVGNAQGALAEICPQRPLVEHKADVIGRWQG